MEEYPSFIISQPFEKPPCNLYLPSKHLEVPVRATVVRSWPQF